MNEFEELLEQYLDETEIEKKKKIDDYEQQTEFKCSKYKHQFNCTITIREFVNEYLDNDHDCNNLRHIGLKSFDSPYVIGVSNDFACKNMEYVLRNEILIVVDSHNDPAAYINPILLKQIETMEQLKYTLTILEKIRIHSLDNIKQLYEEFDKTNKRMMLVNREYLEGNELLRKLNKNHVLAQIKKYINETTNVNISFEENVKEIEETLITEYQLIEKIENVIDDIECNDEITHRVNRQRKVISRSKRKVLR